MDIVTGLRQARAVITTERTGTNDSYAGFFGKWSIHKTPVVTKIAEKYNSPVGPGGDFGPFSSQPAFTFV
jgi:hypothetical protein